MRVVFSKNAFRVAGRHFSANFTALFLHLNYTNRDVKPV
jgi:hypothetical protein